MKVRTFVVFCSLFLSFVPFFFLRSAEAVSYPIFPVIIVETLARFFFPSLSMQTRETNIKGRGGKQYVYS